MGTNEKIIAGIQLAFPAHTMHASSAFDDWGRTYPDATAYIRQIEGKNWRAVDAAWLVKRSDALGFLGTRWLVDVLPVHLIAALNDGVWSPATEMLVLILAKPDKHDRGLGHARFSALVEALTAAQRVVVGDVLEQLAEIDPEGSLGLAARGALERCWNGYRNTEGTREARTGCGSDDGCAIYTIGKCLDYRRAVMNVFASAQDNVRGENEEQIQPLARFLRDYYEKSKRGHELAIEARKNALETCKSSVP